LHEQKRGKVAVYDFGGGTFDISILKLISTTDGDIYQVLSTNGDTHLAATISDNALQSLARKEILAQGVDIASHSEINQEFAQSFNSAKHETFRRGSKPRVKFPLPNGSIFSAKFRVPNTIA